MDSSARIETLYDRIGGHEKLAKLLHHFYADVRQHQLIGPVFNKQISDWPEHLKLIANFWTRLTGGPSNYSGNVPGKHILLGLSPIHFQAWLQLWEFNCRNYLKRPEAEEMIELAHDIGRRLSRLVSAGMAAR
jgi:hemoglobin